MRPRSGGRRTARGTGGTQRTGHHWSVNIRKYVTRANHIQDLVALGSLPQQAADFLAAAVASGLNVLVVGGAQAGKTTFLNALSGCIPARERVITCEEVFELAILAGLELLGLCLWVYVQYLSEKRGPTPDHVWGLFSRSPRAAEGESDR